MGARAAKIGRRLSKTRFGKSSIRRARNYKPGRTGRAVQRTASKIGKKARIHRMTAARKAALRKAQAASARKRKTAAKSRKVMSKSGKKLKKKRGIQEYVDRKGRKTGWATNKASKTNRGAMRNVRKAARYNRKVGRKLKRAGVKNPGYRGRG